MYKEYENLLCPWGGTMADVMKDTPKDQISKVFLEEKLFKTWYDGRTVLLGDGKSLFLLVCLGMLVKFSVSNLNNSSRN
jgi:hypothetical protein